MTTHETNVTPVSLAEVKNILKKLSKERKELLYEQRIALEHAQKFSKLPLKKTQDLIKDLKKLEIIDDLYAYKIADLLPTSVGDVKTIFAKSRITLSENNIKKILEIVNKYFVE
ncbi:MAG: DNA-directed RNA polymerase subunit F [Candidatus Thermoplasmatota archaeon]|nr:DNA-directed RNA polymerase subunit F [Candidatus Thermoplasmatota archaeon]